MEKKDFELKKEIFEVQPGGVKEACLVVKEYLKNINNLTESAVTRDEFMKAASIILNYSFTTSNKNTRVDEYYCKEDCRIDSEFCQGQFSIEEDSKKICKYYKDPNNN